MTIVPDTNVIVSSQLNPAGNEAQILKFWYKSWVEFALSEAILSEYRRVFHYRHIFERLQRVEVDVDKLVDELRDGSDIVSGTVPVEPIVADPKDEMFLSCAVEAEADAIVTGDKEHLLPIGSFEGIPLVSPRKFLSTFYLAKKPA